MGQNEELSSSDDIKEIWSQRYGRQITDSDSQEIKTSLKALLSMLLDWVDEVDQQASGRNFKMSLFQWQRQSMFNQRKLLRIRHVVAWLQGVFRHG